MEQKSTIDKTEKSKTDVNSIHPERVSKLGINAGLRNLKSPVRYSKTQVFPIMDNVFADNRIVAHNKSDPSSVPFQMLRSKVLSELRLNDWNSLAITAPTPGSGKTLIAINLAMIIAQEANQTVLLVDMDLRKPSINKYFGIHPNYGISDFINNGISVEKILINPGIDRLVILPGRERILNSAEALSSPTISNLVNEIKERYESRIVIFDLPPLLVSDDVLAFLPHVDCSLMVVESGGNTRKEIEDSVKMLKTRPFLGTVLNKETDIKENFVY